jgi:hypothetical protein
MDTPRGVFRNVGNFSGTPRTLKNSCNSLAMSCLESNELRLDQAFETEARDQLRRPVRQPTLYRTHSSKNFPVTKARRQPSRHMLKD